MGGSFPWRGALTVLFATVAVAFALVSRREVARVDGLLMGLGAAAAFWLGLTVSTSSHWTSPNQAQRKTLRRHGLALLIGSLVTLLMIILFSVI